MKKRILGILLCLIVAVGMIPTMAMAQETAPTFNLETDLEGIQIPENLVTCICTTTDESKTYGQLPESFAKANRVIEEDGEWTVFVQIEKSTYLKKFDADTGTKHSADLNYSSDFTTPIQFKMKYEGDKWVLDGVMPEDKKLHFTCNNDHKNQTPNLPMYPTIDNISGLNDEIVAVLCANTQAGQESGKYYGLLNGGFTSTMPTREEGDMYESTITLIPSVYCNQYSTDTGIPHTVNPKQNAEDLTFVVNYDEEKKLWMPKEEVKPMGIWVNCDKHENSTSVTPVYPPSGGGSTIKPGSNGSNQGDGAVVNPDNNQGDNKDKVDTGNKQTGKTKKSDTMEKVPKTGDNTGMTIWLVLLLLSVGALFGTVAFDRKRKRI